MTRTLDSGMNTALGAQGQTILWLFELDFSSGTLRLTSGVEDVTWDSRTWTAVGGHMQVEQIEESVDAQVGVNLTMDGVDQTVISLVLGANYLGRQATIYYALVGTNGAIVNNPIQFGPYYMLSPFTVEEQRSSEGGGTCTVRTRLTSRLSPIRRVKGIVTNVRSHEKHYPGDLFFAFVPELIGKDVVWGGQKSRLGDGYTGPVDNGFPGGLV